MVDMVSPNFLLMFFESLNERVKALGIAEVEKRIGQQIDANFITSLYTVDDQGRPIATQVYNDLMAKLL